MNTGEILDVNLLYCTGNTASYTGSIAKNLQFETISTHAAPAVTPAVGWDKQSQCNPDGPTFALQNPTYSAAVLIFLGVDCIDLINPLIQTVKAESNGAKQQRSAARNYY